MATPDLTLKLGIDVTDAVASLRKMAQAINEAADAIESLDGHTAEADPIAGTVTPEDPDADPER